MRPSGPPRRRPRVKIKWEPRDIWIGVFWDREWHGYDVMSPDGYSVYICIIPCLPIHIRFGGYDWQRYYRERFHQQFREANPKGLIMHHGGPTVEPMPYSAAVSPDGTVIKENCKDCHHPYSAAIHHMPRVKGAHTYNPIRTEMKWDARTGWKLVKTVG